MRRPGSAGRKCPGACCLPEVRKMRLGSAGRGKEFPKGIEKAGKSVYTVRKKPKKERKKKT